MLSELLKTVPEAKSSLERQHLAAKIVAELPGQLDKMLDAEIAYNKDVAEARVFSASHAESVRLSKTAPAYRVYVKEKMLYSQAESALKILNMFTGKPIM